MNWIFKVCAAVLGVVILIAACAAGVGEAPETWLPSPFYDVIFFKIGAGR